MHGDAVTSAPSTHCSSACARRSRGARMQDTDVGRRAGRAETSRTCAAEHTPEQLRLAVHALPLPLLSNPAARPVEAPNAELNVCMRECACTGTRVHACIEGEGNQAPAAQASPRGLRKTLPLATRRRRVVRAPGHTAQRCSAPQRTAPAPPPPHSPLPGARRHARCTSRGSFVAALDHRSSEKLNATNLIQVRGIR